MWAPLLSLLLAVASGPTAAGETVTRLVHTRHGALRGRIVSIHDGWPRKVERFLGVPYALPPLGQMRFMPTKAPVPWSGELDAARPPPVCPQRLPAAVRDAAAALRHMSRARFRQLRRLAAHLRNQSEDCLYLNIYAPLTEASFGHGDSEALLPVIVYIHGGSYTWSTGNVYDGTVLASYGRVIVVTLNYRLGVLGFMKPATTESANSNFALLDQVAALLWIKENIRAFRGDPGRVTVMGHDTGAVCASLLAASPVTRSVTDGLFQRAILMSGSSLSPWAMTSDPVKVTVQVARELNCPINDDVVLLKCLRSKTVDELTMVEVQWPRFSPSMGPAVDSIVVQKTHNDPTDLGNALDRLDLLYGVTSQENFHVLNNAELTNGISEERRNEILKSFLCSGYRRHTSQLLASASDRYMDYDAPADVAVYRDQTLGILSDAEVVAPMVKMAKIHSRSVRKSHMYVFSHVTRNGEYLQKFGSVSGEELPYIFGAPFASKNDYFPERYSRTEMALSEYMMASWTNFAKTGDPNLMPEQDFLSVRSDSPFYDVVWPPYDERSQEYMDLAPTPQVRRRYRATKLHFWNNVVPTLLRSSEPEPPPSPDSPDPPCPVGPTLPPPLLFQRPLPPFLNGTYTEEQLFAVFTDLIRRVNDSMSAGDVRVAGAGPAGGGDGGGGGGGGTLSIVIVVGVCFLLLNLMVLGGVYYQKQRLRARERRLERQNSLSEADGSRTSSLRGSRENVARPRLLARSASGDDLLVPVVPAAGRESAAARVTISDSGRASRRSSEASAAGRRGAEGGAAPGAADGADGGPAPVVRERSLDQRTPRGREAPAEPARDSDPAVASRAGARTDGSLGRERRVSHGDSGTVSRSGSVRSKGGQSGTLPRSNASSNHSTPRQQRNEAKKPGKAESKTPAKSPQTKKKGVTIPEKSFAQDILHRMLPKSHGKATKGPNSPPRDRPPRGILKSARPAAGQASDSSAIYCEMVPALKGSISGLSTGSGCRMVYRTDSTCQVDLPPEPDSVSVGSARSLGQLSRSSSVGGRSSTSIHFVPRAVALPAAGAADFPTVRFESRAADEPARDEPAPLRRHHGAPGRPEVPDFRRSIAGLPANGAALDEAARSLSLQRGGRRARQKPPPPPRTSSRPEGLYGSRDVTCPHGYPVHPPPPGPDPLERYVPGQAESPDPAAGPAPNGAPAFPAAGPRPPPERPTALEPEQPPQRRGTQF